MTGDHQQTSSATSYPTKHALVGLTRDEFTQAIIATGARSFRARQVWHWLYHHGVTDFAAMRNIGKDTIKSLTQCFSIGRSQIAQELVSEDETRKWLLQFADGRQAETVFIPEEDRGTLCISSQVGCTLACTFCHTGTQKLVRNLTAEEIVGQVLLAKDRLEQWGKKRTAEAVGQTHTDIKRPYSLTNIVLMGMGEPLFNYDNVAAAIKVMLDPEGLEFSRRKITLSTSGVVPMIERCGAELGVSLAISLHAVRDDLRNEIVPINRKWPIAELLNACRNYPGSSNARRITFEYVMLKGINDSDNDAHALVGLLKGIPAKVNLIPFNPWPGAPYECSSNNRIRSFARIVNDAGYSSPVRTPRGQDIFAACGQLKSASSRNNSEKVKL